MALGDRLTSAILHIVSQIRRGVLRTQLMKLLYLADYYSYAVSGRTITGIQYRFDRAGPLSAAVYSCLEEMVGHEVDMEERVSKLGRVYFVYRPGQTPPRFRPSLTDAEREILEEVLSAFGTEPWESLLEVVYETPPMREAEPGGLIRMKTLRERARERIEHARRTLRDRYSDRVPNAPDAEYVQALLKEAEETFELQSRALP